MYNKIKESCNAYHSRTVSAGEVVEDVIAILDAEEKGLRDALYANPSTDINPNYDKYRKLPRGDYSKNVDTMSKLVEHGNDSIKRVRNIIKLYRWNLPDDRLIGLIEDENMNFLTFCQSN